MNKLPYRRLTWITDPHLNFVDIGHLERFIEKINGQAADALLVSGDISEAEDLTWQLRRLFELTDKPLFFVLGNHDFYRNSIANVRARVNAFCKQLPQLTYLTNSPYIQLDERWTLCGDDGWADGRIGDYHASPVKLNDYQLIEDFEQLEPHSRLKLIRRMGAASALRLRWQLEQARSTSDHSIVLTHIPPFRQACLYDGQVANDDWAPFFTCHAMGWILRRFCHRYPKHRVLVLCGHSHHECTFRAADNLLVRTGFAEYARPQVNGCLDLAASLGDCMSSNVDCVENECRE